MRPLRKDLWSAWWRSFAVQGSWNYRTMIGGGMAFTMLPLLRRIHAGDPVRLSESVARHQSAFNSHPYLAGLAAGALARAELDGESSASIERFRTALRGPLGTVGDRLIWAAWRPVCLLSAIAAFGLGVDPLWSVALFLLTFNAGHIAIRVWGFRSGWREGLGVGKALHESWLEWVPRRLAPLILFLLGLDAVLLSRSVLDVVEWNGFFGGLAAVAAFVALVAFRWPRRAGRVAAALVLAIPVAWLVVAALIG
ncbi:MAG: PTS system mannose/fructose/sorbose family transporter subunit IID [marine benthic group bacterium]|jgi:PTS system mannose-specific IID component|nr:PTS system mannose/fructose/sorbose family transporter subunit IID [Gemmatimonadota bacterium]MCL7963120.1 PTS system mannose/fructose/sorbose family transporter subunit IID [Candidatus Carthagonibacter metallireducens]MCL7936698.1 PTS system mannose/fructose/sorbose family transporter subunit IID [Gemmatimonadota bacterium]MCL7957024.1 PTS system mannose/fructose/sorbose family transporter subunit IID [Gemmatimonadota bacterium]MCL7967066.1 PTS system mannose/fructose/sorbose family transpo